MVGHFCQGYFNGCEVALGLMRCGRTAYGVQVLYDQSMSVLPRLIWKEVCC
jgi:hypothetical protein